jgi:hypothetical protein
MKVEMEPKNLEPDSDSPVEPDQRSVFNKQEFKQ